MHTDALAAENEPGAQAVHIYVSEAENFSMKPLKVSYYSTFIKGFFRSFQMLLNEMNFKKIIRIITNLKKDRMKIFVRL